MTQENNEAATKKAKSAKAKGKEPLKVGLMVGREWSWPPAFIDKVNNMDAGVTVEFVKIGGYWLRGWIHLP